MRHEVNVIDAPARPTAVVATTTTWDASRTLWRGLLDEVWACLHAGGIVRACPHGMLYRGDLPHDAGPAPQTRGHAR